MDGSGASSGGAGGGPAPDDGRSWRGAYVALLVWLAVQIAALTLLSWAQP